MSLDYYEILEIKMTSNNEELVNAYRRLSLKFHPKRNSSKDFEINNFNFHKIAEAYEVLSNRNFKSKISFFKRSLR